MVNNTMSGATMEVMYDVLKEYKTFVYQKLPCAVVKTEINPPLVHTRILIMIGTPQDMLVNREIINSRLFDRNEFFHLIGTTNNISVKQCLQGAGCEKDEIKALLKNHRRYAFYIIEMRHKSIARATKQCKSIVELILNAQPTIEERRFASAVFGKNNYQEAFK